ncbi:ABC transporter permease [bacterium]|nr:ABC transporter permease [bacterium]
MRLVFFLAWRFLFSRHRSGFVRLLTYLSILSVGLALGAFVIVLSVMNGFDRDLQARIVAGIGAVRGYAISGRMNLTPEREAVILATPGVTGVTPELQVSALLRASSRGPGLAASGEAQVTAVPIDRKMQTSPLARQLKPGSALPGETQILLGSALAEKLAVDIGSQIDAVFLVPPGSSPLFAAAGVSEEMRLEVSGIYRTGYYEVDAASALLPAVVLRAIFGLHPDLAHTLEIGVSDPEAAQTVAADLQAALLKDGLYFRSWKDLREALFKAIRLEKLVMSLILALFGLIAVFSVLSALTSTAVEKRRELAALRAMGMTRGAVASVLITAGAIAGGLGVFLGGILSAGAHLLITRGDLIRLPPDIYDLDRLPSEWSTGIFLAAAAALFCLSILAASLPAVIQSKKAPSEALREE